MPVIGHRVDGLKVAQARLKLKGSPNQREFAERLGIHWVTMSRIENGKANVSLDLLERIADETGQKRDHFLADDEEDEESRVVDDHTVMLSALAVALDPFHPRYRELAKESA